MTHCESFRGGEEKLEKTDQCPGCERVSTEQLFRKFDLEFAESQAFSFHSAPEGWENLTETAAIDQVQVLQTTWFCTAFSVLIVTDRQVVFFSIFVVVVYPPRWTLTFFSGNERCPSRSSTRSGFPRWTPTASNTGETESHSP